jgi:hypothetical protein
MANELLYGSGEASALFDASRVTTLFLETIADRDYSLMAHPAMMYLGDAAGGMSSVSSIPIVNLADDEFASKTEVEALTPSDITTDLPTITVARYGLERDLADFAASLDGTGALDVVGLADALVTAANLTMLTLLNTCVGTITAIKGTSGATMTHATMLEAKQALRTARVGGPYLCLLHPKQFNEWETDFHSLGGAVQFKQGQATEMSRLTGGSYVGTWDNVDVYISTKVVTDGTDHIGGIWGMNTIGWRSLSVKPQPGRIVLADAGFCVVEAYRQPLSAKTSIVGNLYAGIGLLQTAGGCNLRSVD